jgi:hypothetical protein
MLDADFTIADSPELVEALRTLTRRYQRAIDASQQEPAGLFTGPPGGPPKVAGFFVLNWTRPWDVSPLSVSPWSQDPPAH